MNERISLIINLLSQLIVLGGTNAYSFKHPSLSYIRPVPASAGHKIAIVTTRGPHMLEMKGVGERLIENIAGQGDHDSHEHDQAGGSSNDGDDEPLHFKIKLLASKLSSKITTKKTSCPLTLENTRLCHQPTSFYVWMHKLRQKEMEREISRDMANLARHLAQDRNLHKHNNLFDLGQTGSSTTTPEPSVPLLKMLVESEPINQSRFAFSLKSLTPARAESSSLADTLDAAAVTVRTAQRTQTMAKASGEFIKLKSPTKAKDRQYAMEDSISTTSTKSPVIVTTSSAISSFYFYNAVYCYIIVYLLHTAFLII